MDTALVDSHVHFCDHTRLAELQRYRSAIGIDGICVLSLPVKQRINFNPEALLAKVRLGDRCYALGCFDFSEVFFPAYLRDGAGAGGRAESRAAAEESAVGRAAAEGASTGGGMTSPDLAAQVRELWNLGFDGLKVFAGKPSFQSQLGFPLDDPLFLRGLLEAGRLGMTALIHVADPPVFWSGQMEAGASGIKRSLWTGGGSGEGKPLPGYEELQGQALTVLEACPGLPVIFPHLLMMAHDLPRLAAILETHSNAYVDLAPGLYFYAELARDRGAAREFFRTYRKRILFGSDGFWFSERFHAVPYTDYAGNLQRSSFLLRFLRSGEELDNPFEPTRRASPQVRGLELPVEVLDQICGENFLRLYSSAPRRIDTGAAQAYLEDFLTRLSAITADPVDREAVEAVYMELKKEH